MADLILLIIWMTIGMIDLCSDKPISKASYFCVWIVVIGQCIARMVT